MFAARELVKSKQKVLVIDRGRDTLERRCEMEETGICYDCEPCNILCGVGGAGTFSDGTLNLRPDVGGNLRDYTDTDAQAWGLVEEVDHTFILYGVRNELVVTPEEEIQRLKQRAASFGVNFVDIKQRHIGTDFTQTVISNFKNDLLTMGVEFLLETKVEDIWLEDEVCCGVLLEGGERIRANAVLLAPGRVGAGWVNELVGRHKIEARHAPIDVGVRVEVPSIVMDWVTAINRDPKFHIHTSHHDDFVRTFCTNRHGFVVKERYDDIVGVNGHSFRDKDSPNTNFALLVTIHLTEPLENTTKYGECIGRLADPLIEPVLKGNAAAINAVLKKTEPEAIKLCRMCPFRMGVMNKSGDTLAVYPPRKAAHLDFYQYEVVQQVLKTRKIAQQRLFLQNGARIYTIAVPLLREEEVIGILAIALDAAEAQKRWDLTEKEFLVLNFNR